MPLLQTALHEVHQELVKAQVVAKDMAYLNKRLHKGNTRLASKCTKGEKRVFLEENFKEARQFSTESATNNLVEQLEVQRTITDKEKREMKVAEDEILKLRDEMSKAEEKEKNLRANAWKSLKENNAQFEKLKQEHKELIIVFRQKEKVREETTLKLIEQEEQNSRLMEELATTRQDVKAEWKFKG